MRGYDSAAVYTFPDFAPVASFDLPRQKQGEGVSIAATGRVRLSSEGAHSAVLQVSLPEDVRALVEPAPASATPGPTPVPSGEQQQPSGSSDVAIVLLGGTVVVIVGIAVLVARKRRTR